MKLLPNYFKKIGLIVVCLSVIYLIFKYTYIEYGKQLYIINNIINYILLIALLLIALSKEKVENDKIEMFRLKSFRFSMLFGIFYYILDSFLQYDTIKFIALEAEHFVFLQLLCYLIYFNIDKRKITRLK